MPVFLPTSILGNSHNLVTFGHSGELMGWFYPHKDAGQHITSCLPCAYIGDAGSGFISYLYEDPWQREQRYLANSNALQTELTGFGLRVTLTDVMPDDAAVLYRRIRVENIGGERRNGGFYHYGHWSLGGHREGNGVVYERDAGALVQSHREASVSIGGDALQSWHCGKAGANWESNARYALEKGVMGCQPLEIGDVNWAFGFYADLQPSESVERTAIFALAPEQTAAIETLQAAKKRDFDAVLRERLAADARTLAPGLETLKQTGASVPDDLLAGYTRSLLALPLLRGEEGVAVAAPEFDPEFISCGGYGYFWPRDGGEYISGLLDAGYPDAAPQMFDWCARHQDAQGFWHQRYFLNGQVAPNWCLPPETLQIDQVGAVGWAYGKWLDLNPDYIVPDAHKRMLTRAADYLISRQDPKTGVHRNAFDTWETFIGSFTYSNAAIYAAFLTAHRVSGDGKYREAAEKMKVGVLKHFVRDAENYRYLVRGFRADGSPDDTVDSASLGAIEPFGLLNLSVPDELELARGTLRAVTEHLEVDWMGARAIRRFEGDNYVGGVPACVNTLWMARCCLHVAAVTGETELIERAQSFLSVVLKRATPTLLLPELMQGPEGQSYWAAPHGWAMSSFVSGVLAWARLQETRETKETGDEGNRN